MQNINIQKENIFHIQVLCYAQQVTNSLPQFF